MIVLARIIASLGIVGRTPLAPGTAGSLCAVIFCVASLQFMPEFLASWWFALWALFFTLIGLWATNYCLVQENNNKDPSWIVIDEVAGQTLTYSLVLPQLVTGCHWMAAAGFALFRLFDITKPFGIKKMEALPGAWGVMSDDLLAGFYAAIVLLVLQIGLL